eukprot:6077487-Amphidinium_carterae.1
MLTTCFEKEDVARWIRGGVKPSELMVVQNEINKCCAIWLAMDAPPDRLESEVFACELEDAYNTFGPKTTSRVSTASQSSAGQKPQIKQKVPELENHHDFPSIGAPKENRWAHGPPVSTRAQPSVPQLALKIQTPQKNRQQDSQGSQMACENNHNTIVESTTEFDPTL